MKKLIVGMSVFLSLCLALITPAYAGGMNGAESRLYGAACGTFTVDGKTYRAYGNYLERVRSYVCQDGVDLTEEQASSGIGMMTDPSSIRSAAQSGYIYQIGASEDSSDNEKDDNAGEENPGSGENDGEDDEPDFFQEEEMESEPFYDEDEYKASDTYKNYKEIIEAGGQSEELIESLETATEKNAKKYEERFQEILDQRQAAPDAQQAADAEAGVGADELLAVTKKASDGMGRILIVLAILFLVVSVVSAILLYKRKCFRRQRKKAHSSGHGQRKMTRRVTGILLIAAAAIQIYALLLCVGCRVSVLTYDNVSKIMEEHGIYRVTYMKMTEEVHALLEKENCMDNLCDESLRYNDFLFDAKKQMRQDMDKGNFSAEYLKVRDGVTESLRQVAYMSSADRDRIASEVLSVYKNYVKNPVGTCLTELGTQFERAFFPGVYLSAAALVLALILLIAMQHHTYKGIRNISFAFVAAAAGFGVSLLYMIIGRPITGMALTPDELYVFFYGCSMWSREVFLTIFVACIIAAIVIGLSGKMLRRRSKEK